MPEVDIVALEMERIRKKIAQDGSSSLDDRDLDYYFQHRTERKMDEIAKAVTRFTDNCPLFQVIPSAQSAQGVKAKAQTVVKVVLPPISTGAVLAVILKLADLIK